MKFLTHTSGAYLGRLRTTLSRLLRRGDPRGIASVEYAVIAGIIALAISASFTMLNDKLEVVLSSLSF
jgi:Flp pilus assembly pilin Flp